MSSNKKKPDAWMQLDEFGHAVSMADAARSDAQSPANDMLAAADGVAAGAASVLADSVHKDAELEVVTASPIAAIDNASSLPSNAVANILDNGTLMSSAYVDQAGGWGLTVAPPGSATAVELAEEAALPDITDETLLEPVPDPALPDLPPSVIELAFDDFGRTGVVIDSVFDPAGDIPSGAVIDDNRPTFNGRGEPDAIVRIYDGQLLIGAAIADENGNWTFQPGEHTPLSDGAHVFAAVTGGVSSALFVLHIDTSATAGKASAMQAVDEGLGGLVLADLLQQPTSELLADEASSAAASPLAVHHAALSPIVPAELWQQDAVPAMM